MTPKNSLPASKYAKPHTMAGKPVTVAANPGKGPNLSRLDNVNAVVGNIVKAEPGATKTAGAVTRGNGAATKGLYARGPLA